MLPKLTRRLRDRTVVTAAILSLMGHDVYAMDNNAFGDNSNGRRTESPIKHLIVIMGENRTFDHVFATYEPRHGERVSNLLSKGIVNPDGTPGPNFFLARQSSATDTSAEGFQLNPSDNVAYSVFPPVLAGGYSAAPFPDVATAKLYETGLPAE